MRVELLSQSQDQFQKYPPKERTCHSKYWKKNFRDREVSLALCLIFFSPAWIFLLPIISFGVPTVFLFIYSFIFALVTFFFRIFRIPPSFLKKSNGLSLTEVFLAREQAPHCFPPHLRACSQAKLLPTLLPTLTYFPALFRQPHFSCA